MTSFEIDSEPDTRDNLLVNIQMLKCPFTTMFSPLLQLNADLLDHSILTGYGKAYTSKGIKDRLKVAKVTNTHALIPQARYSLFHP